MSDEPDWNGVDSDWIAENRPDKLNETHRQRLIMKHGPRAGAEKFQAAINGMLRKTQVAPPYRSTKR